jgi:hypothetical protein
MVLQVPNVSNTVNPIQMKEYTCIECGTKFLSAQRGLDENITRCPKCIGFTSKSTVTTNAITRRELRIFYKYLVLGARIISVVLLVTSLLMAIFMEKERRYTLPPFSGVNVNISESGQVIINDKGHEEKPVTIVEDCSELYWAWVGCPLSIGLLLGIRTFIPGFGLLRGLLTCIGAAGLILPPYLGIPSLLKKPSLIMNPIETSCLAIAFLILLLGFMPKKKLTIPFIKR